jgi:hypothetical protein
MTVENNPTRHPVRETIVSRTGSHGWMTLAIGIALIFGIILMLPNGNDTASNVTENTQRIDRSNAAPVPAPEPPANTHVPTAPPSPPPPQ